MKATFSASGNLNPVGGQDSVFYLMSSQCLCMKLHFCPGLQDGNFVDIVTDGKANHSVMILHPIIGRDSYDCLTFPVGPDASEWDRTLKLMVLNRRWFLVRPYLGFGIPTVTLVST